MSNVDGSLVLGVRLSDEDLDTQARRIGEKVRSAIESSLKNSDLLKVIKIEGAGKSQGEVYGNEFIDAYLKVLKTGNAGLARNFESTFQKIFSRQGEDQAKKFISQFEGVLNSRGDKIAAQFARSLGASLDVGGKETGKRYVEQFEKGFVGVAPKIANEFDRQFQSILAKSNFSTANLFSKSYGDVAKSSKEMAEFFAQNFEAVLRATNAKTASEYARGFNLAFSKQGTEGGREYSVNFLREIQKGLDKAEEAAKQAKLDVKTTIQPPSAPGNLNNILATGGASTAKYFESVYKNVAKASEYSANLFSDNFQKILAGSGSKSANEFARGFEIAFRNGGDRDAKNYIQSFNQRLQNEKLNAVKTQLEAPPKPSSTALNNVLNLGNAGSARLFESTFQNIAKQSEKVARDFSETFQRILAANGPKVANEFAKGFQLSFSSGGEKSAQQFSSQFQNKLAEAAKQAAANMKTTLESPTIPQSFVNTFSRILNKSGSDSARQFSATWNQIYQLAGEKSANEFSNKFQQVLRKGGSDRAKEYAKGMSLAYDKAGADAAENFSKQFKNRAGIDFNKIGSFMRDTLVTAIGNGLSNMFTGLLNGIFSSIRSGVTSITGFIGDSIGKSLTNQKKFIELKAITEATPEQTKKIETEVRNTALATSTKIPDLTEVALELSKAGVPLENINQKLLTSISLMSRLSGEGAKETAGMVAQIQSSFGLPLDQMVDTMDLMTAVANGSQASIGSLSQGMTYAGATAKALGVDVKETAFLLGVLANNGLDASRGGTALQNMFGEMAKNAKTLKEIGIEVFNPDGTQRFQAAVKELGEKLKQLSNEDQYKVLSEVFGERGLRGVQALITGLNPLDEKTKQLSENVDKYADSLKRSGDNLDSPAGKIDILLNKIDEFRDRFGKAFEPAISALTDFGSQTMDYLLNNTALFDTLNQANQEFADFLGQHPEYAKMLADIISQLATELFTVLLDQTKQLLAYLKENPNAVREMVTNFGNFANAVIQLLPVIAKMVELLYNGAQFLGIIQAGSGGDFGGSSEGSSMGGSGGNYFKSGLFTGPEGNIGSGSAYHIDTKFAKDLPIERVIEAMDSMAEGYEAAGKQIVFSNAAVAGQIYNRNDPNRKDLIKRAFDAHSHSVHANWNSLDYYIPDKKDGNNTYAKSTENAEMILPKIPGGKVEYGSGGGYGNYAVIMDASGRDIIKTGHGDDRKPLPSSQSFSATSQSQTPGNKDEGLGGFLKEGFKASLSVLPGMQFLNPMAKMGTEGMGMMRDMFTGKPLDQIGRKRQTTSFKSPNNFSTVTRPNSDPDPIASRSDLNVKTAQPVLPSGLTSKGRELSQYLTNPRIRAFFDAVSVAEGTNKGHRGGYDVSFGGAHTTSLNANHPYYGRELTPEGRSSASGRYQAMGHSWAEEAQKLGLKKMDPVSQDLFALGRLDMRGLLKTIGSKDPSKWTEDDWQQVSMEWASVSSPTGANYHGQKTPEGSRFMENYRKSLKNLGASGVNPIDTFKAKSGLPQYKSLNLLGDSDPLKEMLALKDSEPSKFDKMRSKRDKEIEKILKEQEKIEKQIADETKKNAAESLKVKREVAKSQREQDKKQLELSIEKNKMKFQGTGFADSYDTASKVALKRFDNQTELEDYRILLEDIDNKIKDINENRSKEAGIGDVLKAYEEQKKAIQGILEETKKTQAEELKNIQLAESSQLAIEKKKQAQEEFVKVFERQKRIQELQQAQKLSKVEDSDFRSVLENSFKMGNLNLEKTIKTQPLEFEIKKLEDEIKLAKESGLDFSDSLELMQAKLNALKADLESVNQEFKITGDTIVAESEKIMKAKLNSLNEAFQGSRSQLLQSSGNTVLDAELNRLRAVNAEKERYRKTEADIMALKGVISESQFNQAMQSNKDINRNTLLGTDSVKGYDDKLFETKVGFLKQSGFGFQAAEMEQTKARVDEIMRFRQEMETLAALKGKIPDEELEYMIRSAQQINGINLQGINNQFETLGNTIKNSVVGEFKSFTMKALTDFDNIGDAFNSLIDNMLNKALEMMLNQAFSGLFGGGGFLAGLFGGGGGGGLDVALDVPLLPGYATGGLVGNNGTSNYSDSIMALLSPGEAVLSADKVRQLSSIGVPNISPANISGGAQNIINTNVIVNVDGNGNVNSNITGDMSELAPMIESMIVSKVSGMRFNPGGILNE